MNIKDIAYRTLTLFAIVAFVSCSDKDENAATDAGVVEIKDIVSAMSRAGSVAELKDYVGKDEFDDKDRAVFVTIKRTEHPINQFTYSNIEFECAASTSAGVKSIGWSRDKNTGTIGGGSAESHPDRIYWSDATNPHTFTGYCKPQQGEGQNAFDWEKKTVNGIEAYYGSIGDPTVHTSTDSIDFRSTFDDGGNETTSGNVELRKNDILLTHSTQITAQDAIAKLYFYHGLAQVRVIVNISDFAAGGGDDTKSTVSNMVLKDMLTMYKWRQASVATEQLGSEDQSAVTALYPSAGVSYNQRKGFNLWIPEPKGVGEKSSRTFTFYGMAVPTQIPALDSEHKGLEFSFKVTYPDPMKPDKMKTHTYNASIGGIHFDAGKCTTISISLNHKNEKMTVAAEYDDWEFIDTPDQGELKKNSTFLAFTNRTAKDGNYNVTIIGDQNATADDATWLYIDGTTKKIVDVYGNDGSKEKPFQISTAEQFLSFAYEVKGTNRSTSVDYTDLKGASKTLSSNFDFTGYHIVLDADLTLQKTETKSKMELDLKKADKTSDSYKNAPDNPEITWIGIGESDKPFNGTFQGGFRHINRLYGKPLFNNVGADGIVDHVFITDAIRINGSGSIAETNGGIICGANIEGDIVESDNTDYCGSIVGVNNGVLIACSHIGSITGNANVLGALLGKNDGIMVTCYNVGDAKNTHSGGKAYAGVGDFTSRSVAYCCYFNKDFYTSQDYSSLRPGQMAFPLSTAVMQSNKYVKQAAVVPQPTEGTNTGEITDPSVKTDMFYWHWSLNTGLTRAIAYLSQCLDAQSGKDEIEFHAPGTEMTATGVGVKLKKTQVEWLVKHYDGSSHQFQFIPGTYPKLK